MTERTEERLELHDPIVHLARSSHRLTAMDMTGWFPRWCLLRAQSMRGWWTRIRKEAPRELETKVCLVGCRSEKQAILRELDKGIGHVP